MKTTADWTRFCLTAGASALGNRRFLNCVWELTYRCNARCAMCSYWRRPSDPRDETDTDHVKAGLDKIAAYGCRLVNFTGGEPMPREDLEAITSQTALAAVAECPGCWYCFRGEADATLSPGGCLEKAALGMRILYRNAARRRPASHRQRRARTSREFAR